MKSKQSFNAEMDYKTAYAVIENAVIRNTLAAELTKIFCANDDGCYGNLPGLEFRRTGPLGYY